MAKAQTGDSRSPRLDDVILYLLAKGASEGPEEGYKISISDVHQVLGGISNDVEDDLEIPVKFQESSGQVYSQQVEEALSELIPYKIPVRNPSFSLDVNDRVAEKALENATENLSGKQKEVLDRIYEESSFHSRLREYAEYNRG